MKSPQSKHEESGKYATIEYFNYETPILETDAARDDTESVVMLFDMKTIKSRRLNDDESEFRYEDVRYSIKNPIAKKLHAKFDSALKTDIESTGARRVLEVGCGEGFIINQMNEILKPDLAVGGDLSEYWLERAERNLSGIADLLLFDVEALPFPDDYFDLVTCIEVLEHVDHPEHGLKEIARVTSEWAIISVPNRYLWRLGNLARGKYFGSLGNTPEHINEWTVSQFDGFIDPYFSIINRQTPFPWQTALLRKK